MATSTYTPIASITLGSSASSVTFSSLSQDYRDLVLVVSGNVTDATSRTLLLELNNSSTNWTRVVMFPTSSATGTDNSVAGINNTNLAPSLHIIQIMDYSATDKHKTVLTRTNRADASIVDAQAMRYASTSAITSVTADVGAYSFKAGSTLALYGIEA